MEKDILQETSMEDMMKAIDETMKPIYSGDIVEGEVISVSINEVLVNIGYINDGIIKKNEICNEDEDINNFIKQGDKIEVFIVKLNDGEGNVVLSKKKADITRAWRELNNAFKNNTILEVKVAEVVKSGVIAYINGIRGFIPASQISVSFVKDLTYFVGKVLKVKVIEFDEKKSKVVLSGKEVELKERQNKKEKVLASLKNGEKRTGIVRRLAKFGAFVDLGGVDGLIHNSDLSWKRVNDPSEVVKVGDKVEVYVLNFDKEKGKIALSLKDIEEDPWNNIITKHKVNDIVEGKVVKLLDFGAFIEIEAGVEGLVHITEITDENIAKPSEVLNIGNKVKVKILEINKEDKRIALSIKEAENRASEEMEKYNDEDEGNFAFADLLKNFKF
ncbi:30S ribosomal protein S1 [Clostridium botulinum]|uniref:30S ribosomal protein S1 n=1 Tax=Clostridium botulinum C/D str. DC5 TaxID=1443128 RepID=A0A0A0IH08_CLOBO|nr:30S ribosomal protein S1 [Clostridium botulinum]KGM93408.1 30S ribosomal protein S1 [Clostridium botulinum D str. CCUG 7971]KGM98850.1 30S ribosomal protein S1 [Clostridium botulinum C/D str. DC5]KOC46884.1 30S ribosomal protein S1 [Clostridium botulinum]KOC55558.1 30S ribosomal protein S1 [Clostridium botulinum]KOC56354.1 30S ribosomal protein S1 [Clostridium botulinum]